METGGRSMDLGLVQAGKHAPPRSRAFAAACGLALTRLCLVGGILMGLCGPMSRAAAPTESQVEAGVVYNFSRFVEWPPQAFQSPGEPFVIGILGNDPFDGRLDEAVHGEQVN